MEHDDDNYEPYIPVRARRKELLQRRLGDVLSSERRSGSRSLSRSRSPSPEPPQPPAAKQAKFAAEEASAPARSREALIQTHGRLVRRQELAGEEEDEVERQLREEAEILRAIRNARALKSAAELAKGIRYDEPLRTSWRPPHHVRTRSREASDRIRAKMHITIEVTEEDKEEVPPPVTTFADLKLPLCIEKHLAQKGVKRPTPIQMQGLSVALSGRDMIGIAFTGSGKTLCFSIPLIMLALEQEVQLPFEQGEGPYGVILCPSRELARQTYDTIRELTDVLARDGYPWLSTVLCIGGVDMREQFDQCGRGLHIAVCTPGRLIDMLTKKRFTLDVCRYICMDEADRMIDMKFEEDMRTVFSFFKGQRQTLLFSATMPTKMKEFARTALVRPITVNVCRAGAANLDVVQEVEYVKPEAKVVYLLECLQKTPPPVMIFSEKKADVDDIHEYLLLKGVQAVGIHGGKDQEERDLAIRAFKEGRKDVLVATDVASKGLDFPNIQHVINFDMPDELENYVHRIGRTGRSGKTGVATTFINDTVPLTTLMDLKYLLKEARQRVPPYLESLHSDQERFLGIGGVQGCSYCGGPGHRITHCPKLELLQAAQSSKIGKGDALRESGGAW